LRSALSKLCSGKLPTKAERIVAARAHPAYFAWLYLKTDDGDPIKPAPVHLEWYKIFLRMVRGDLRYVGIQAPKSHAKSTIFTKISTLWLTCVTDPNLRIINASVNSELAERFMRANRRELESNELLIEDFGPFKPDQPEKWTQSELIVRRTSTSQSPTWRAVGSAKPVQGGRSDWAMGDDLADLENSMTQRQRDKLQEWVDGDLLGTLEPDGRALIVGTAKHNDDVLMRIEKKSKLPGSQWHFWRFDAIVDEERKITLWPARWSWDALMAKKAVVGSMTFNRDYRNVATNDETSLFPMAMLERAKNRDAVFEDHYGAGDGETERVIAGIDLAIIENERDAQASDGDYTVVMVWRRADNGRRRLCFGLRKRGLGMTPQITMVESTLRRYPTLRVATVEANQAQRWFASSLLAASKGDLPIRKHVTGKGVRVDIYEGIPSLQALFEANLIELPYGDDERTRAFVDVFINELHGLGVEAHDDTVLAFWLAEIGARRSGMSFTSAPVGAGQERGRKPR
jgi:hypothetical protein